MKNIKNCLFISLLVVLAIACDKSDDSLYDSKDIAYALALSEDTITFGESVTIYAEINKPLPMYIYAEKTTDKTRTLIGEINSLTGSFVWTPTAEQVELGGNYVVLRVNLSSSHSISKYQPIFIKKEND